MEGYRDRSSSSIEIISIDEGINSIEEIINDMRDMEYLNEITKNDLEFSYNQFALWLNNLIESNPINGEIVAISFGVYETRIGFQLYVVGSKSWSFYHDDWIDNKEYVPKCRKSNIRLINRIKSYYDKDEYIKMFFSIMVIITYYILKYVKENKDRVLKNKNINISLGLDDGDIINLCRIYNNKIEVYKKSIPLSIYE